MGDATSRPNDYWKKRVNKRHSLKHLPTPRRLPELPHCRQPHRAVIAWSARRGRQDTKQISTMLKKKRVHLPYFNFILAAMSQTVATMDSHLSMSPRFVLRGFLPESPFWSGYRRWLASIWSPHSIFLPGNIYCDQRNAWRYYALQVKLQSIEIHIKGLEGAFLTRTDSSFSITYEPSHHSSALWLKVARLEWCEIER